MKQCLSLIIMLALAACATQRYGRMTPLSEIEKQEYSCKEIKIESAKTDEFLNSVKMQRHDTNGAHVMGFLGDFGIGNVTEGDAAELSGEKRLSELKSLNTQKECN
jgi:uncharacterized membrane protein YjgN (DUF898 family)